jgi:hypothetical protein
VNIMIEETVTVTVTAVTVVEPRAQVIRAR